MQPFVFSGYRPVIVGGEPHDAGAAFVTYVEALFAQEGDDGHGFRAVAGFSDFGVRSRLFLVGFAINEQRKKEDEGYYSFHG